MKGEGGEKEWEERASEPMSRLGPLTHPHLRSLARLGGASEQASEPSSERTASSLASERGRRGGGEGARGRSARLGEQASERATWGY